MEQEREFELKLAGKRKPVVWLGVNGVNAAHRYADANPEAEVVAWRERVRTNFIVRGPFEGARFID